MKRACAFLTAALIALSFGTSVSAATKVFLLAGQSNMAGVGGYTGYNLGAPPWGDPPGNVADAPCPANYANQPTVKFWNYNPDALEQVYAPYPDQFPNLFVHHPGVGNGWINLQNGYGYMVGQFGPELSFGARLHELYPGDDIYLVKLGISGTSLGSEWNPAGTGGSLFNAFQDRVNAAMANLRAIPGKNPTIAGMIWMQGENDATVGSYAQAYASNLSALVAKVRSFSGAEPNMKFVCGRITPDVALWGGTYNTNLVRNAQWTISNRVANASCVDTDDLEKAYYEHYGTDGQIQLGLRFANEFAPVPEPSTLVLICTAAFGLLGYRRWRHHCEA